MTEKDTIPYHVEATITRRVLACDDERAEELMRNSLESMGFNIQELDIERAVTWHTVGEYRNGLNPVGDYIQLEYSPELKHVRLLKIQGAGMCKTVVMECTIEQVKI